MGRLLGLHEGDDDLCTDGDFLAVDREGLIAPLADRGDGGVGELGVAAYGRDLLDAAVSADQGFENNGSLNVSAASGFGIVRFDTLVEKIFGEFRFQADELIVVGWQGGFGRFGEHRGRLYG